MEELEETSRLVFHGTAHVVTTSVIAAAAAAGSTLRVEVETEDGKSRWCGEFPARYVEGITQKTGSAKRFPVFVKMLLAALGHDSSSSSGSVFVDLLTYADLELLKARRVGSGNNNQQQAAGVSGSEGGANRATATTGTTSGGGGGGSGANNKRYLILTYAAEYDRVHYPLPLAFVDSPQRQQLERTIDRLREELSRRSLETATPARNGSKNDRAAEAQLVAGGSRRRCRWPDGAGERRARKDFSAGGHRGGRSSGGCDEHTRSCRREEEEASQLDDLRDAHERLRLESTSEIRKLRREAREGAKTVEMAASTAGQAEDQVASLQEELEVCERALAQARDKHRREVDGLDKELEKERVRGRAMRAKIRELSALRGGGAAAGPRSYSHQQQQQARRLSSPFGGGGGTTAGTRRGGGTTSGGYASSSVNRSRSAGSSRRRRLAESSSTTRSIHTHARTR
ncbi:protein required for templated centriole assembly [Ectocarpus siliculosus]|uniref:Protein required for templated centriole assembly n=1 Tax=Ectocarpus siliculosus TaxID=2880 RepID=D7FWW4_ECTSI|nr:protein required for templated centriole assembly [Ectocarpus siliculosus]|eukprot:CBJ32202.1 protein required for templated centriole assembly [Ectocarpus siliculosus]